MKPGPPRSRRLPLEPLLEYVRQELRNRYRLDSMMNVAREVERSPRQLYEWRKKGIPIDTADYICQKVLGRHPYEIWINGEWHEIPNTKH